jgi:hypothetical protein
MRIIWLMNWASGSQSDIRGLTSSGDPESSLRKNQKWKTWPDTSLGLISPKKNDQYPTGVEKVICKSENEREERVFEMNLQARD